MFQVWVYLVGSLLTARWDGTVVTGEELFNDEAADYPIDDLSEKGIRLLMTWRQNFQEKFSTMNQTISWMESLLNDHYSNTTMPNITEYLRKRVKDINTDLEKSIAEATSQNLTNKGAKLTAFMRTPDSMLNIQGAYDINNRALGTFTAPRRGLYQVIVRSGMSRQGFDFNVTRNGQESITGMSYQDYYSTKMRIRLLWLDAGDDIFINNTKSAPSYFGVVLLRLQTLMPSL